jgi:hypothetical protein
MNEQGQQPGEKVKKDGAVELVPLVRLQFMRGLVNSSFASFELQKTKFRYLLRQCLRLCSRNRMAEGASQKLKGCQMPHDIAITFSRSCRFSLTAISWAARLGWPMGLAGTKRSYG